MKCWPALNFCSMHVAQYSREKLLKFILMRFPPKCNKQLRKAIFFVKNLQYLFLMATYVVASPPKNYRTKVKKAILYHVRSQMRVESLFVCVSNWGSGLPQTLG